MNGSINTFAYVKGNPLIGIDPLGLYSYWGGPGQWGQENSDGECGEKCECWLSCMARDPLLPVFMIGVGAPLFGVKTPSQIRPNASMWGSIDRRFPNLPGANPDWGPEVRRAGKVQRIKCLGRYGTAAAATAAFAVGYTIGATGRCWVECRSGK